MKAKVPYCFTHNERVSLGEFSQILLPNPPLNEDFVLTALDLNCDRPKDVTVSAAFVPDEPWGNVNAALFANQEPWAINPVVLLKAGEQMRFRFERRWSIIGFLLCIFRRRFPVIQIAIHGLFYRDVLEGTPVVKES
jgi:hypothetical protein